MPNHVHVMAETLDGHALGAIVASWKQYVARMANRHLARSGPFWHADYVDRNIRNHEHYDTALHYIEANPMKAGLVARAADWRWSSAWRRLTT
jgi:putative transposase